MIPEYFKTLVDKLQEKTTRKETIWSRTSLYSEFKLDLEQGAITVNKWDDEEERQSYVSISILNNFGDKIDSFVVTSMEKEDYKCLDELYTLIKRAYYKVEETFQNIFNELNSSKTIGTEDDDNLPF